MTVRIYLTGRVRLEGCRKLLAEELGINPAPQTEAVYVEILRA